MANTNSIELELYKAIAALGCGQQSEIAKAKIRDARRVHISPIKDVLTSEEIDKVKSIIRPRKGECYVNAYQLTMRIGGEYIEGCIDMNGFCIDHAFNKVRGKYIDITCEIALGEDMSDIDPYYMFGEYTKRQIADVALQTQVYGGVYEYHVKRAYEHKYGKKRAANDCRPERITLKEFVK